MKEFNLEQAMSGAKVCTRDGRNVRIVCQDVKDTHYPILALVSSNDGLTEDVEQFSVKGEWNVDEISPLDLFIAPAKHEGWVAVLKHRDVTILTRRIYASQEDAIQGNQDEVGFMGVAHVEWEE